VRVWDVRQLGQGPAAVLGAGGPHSHWVWRVAYNRFHDQLLLSAGSDGRVALHRAAALSSAGREQARPGGAPGTQKPGGLAGAAPDGARVVASWEQHEESVYAAAWSGHDPWLLASLGYDGRLAVHSVPQDIKYSIIL
jgi:WD40 repeat protein